MKFPLIKPYIDDNIKNKVIEVLDSGFLTEGSVTKELEKHTRDYIGVKHAIAVTSCTTGLEIALRALGVGPGDEVIVPDYTYPATAAVVNIVGATAVIVDIEKNTMLIDYDEIEKAITENTRAIIPVSIFGNPLDYDRLDKIKSKHDLYIVEDAACSIGAQSGGKMVGSEADISVFSFHPRKFITTGEGGMITTNNDKWADWMESYKHFGMGINQNRESTCFDMIGTNYKLSNIQSAVGLGQMYIIDLLLQKRRELAQNYLSMLKENSAVILPETNNNAAHSYQSFCLFVDERDRIMKEMRNSGIETQIGTYSLHLHKAFYNNKLCKFFGHFENSIYAFKHCLTLPLYHDLKFEDQRYICDTLVKITNN